MRGGIRDVPNFKLACFVFSSLSGHVRTCLTTYIWSRKGLDVTCARLPTDHVLFQAHTTHSVTEVSLSRGPRVCNSLPGHLRDEDITYSSFRRELKTYWFSCNRGAM